MGYIINLKADTGLVDRSENTTRFYRDIKDYRPFDIEEEKRWFTKLKLAKERIKTIDKQDKANYQKAVNEYDKIRDYIVLCNQRLVISAARNYSSTDTLTDYIDEINFGLLEAVDKFDVDRGVRFNSYAMWYVKRAINAFKYGDFEMVKKTNLYKTFHVMAKAKNKFMQENEREPSDDELLDILNNDYKKNIKNKHDLLDINYSSIDYEAQDGDENANNGDVAYYNRMSASYNNYETTETHEFNTKLTSSLLSVLPKRERQIIEMRFGLYGDKTLHREYEIGEISEIIGLTSERVRQLELHALKTLKEEYKNRINEYH